MYYITFKVALPVSGIYNYTHFKFNTYFIIVFYACTF